MDGKITAYRRAETMGKSQIDLILTVYDGAIKSLKTAAEHYSNARTDEGYAELQKTKRFVTHLFTTLDQEKGGEVADNLGKMYVWVISQLHVLEATKDQEQFESVLTVLNNLRAGWAELKAQSLSESTGKVANSEGEIEAPQTVDEFVTTA